MKLLLAAVAALMLTAACTSSAGSGGGSGGGTGLISGTLDNALAKDMGQGMPEKDAKQAVNGSPLMTDSAGCDVYRGVNLRGITEIKANGVLWTICYSGAQVASIDASCPNPWQPGEFQRYKDAGYSADPSNCAR